MEHLADELDTRRLVWVGLLEVHHQPECPVLERCISGPNNDGVPMWCVSLDVRYAVACGAVYHVITLSAMGEAETPAGGSVCMRCNTESVFLPESRAARMRRPVAAGRLQRPPGWRTLKSRIKRRRAAVDMVLLDVFGVCFSCRSVGGDNVSWLRARQVGCGVHAAVALESSRHNRRASPSRAGREISSNTGA